jgi:hypothetical protein
MQRARDVKRSWAIGGAEMSSLEDGYAVAIVKVSEMYLRAASE